MEKNNERKVSMFAGKSSLGQGSTLPVRTRQEVASPNKATKNLQMWVPQEPLALQLLRNPAGVSRSSPPYLPPTVTPDGGSWLGEKERKETKENKQMNKTNKNKFFFFIHKKTRMNCAFQRHWLLGACSFFTGCCRSQNMQLFHRLQPVSARAVF
jgi:hypothetical protein